MKDFADNTRWTALIVCRVSDKSQLKGSGLDSQEHRCRQHADIKGYPVEQVFFAAKSGGLSLMQRPEIQELLAHIDQNRNSVKHYVVILDDHKRFAREAEYHLQLRRLLGQRGVRVEFLNFKPEETPEGKFMELVFAGQAQLEREQNARQARQKSIARLEQGYCVQAVPPIGYKYVDAKGGGKVLVRHEPYASIVQEALEGFASGRFASQSEVTRFLEANPKFPKKGKNGSTTQQSIVHMLRRHLYAGLVDARPWGLSVVEGKHEGLISVATFERIQQKLDDRVYVPARKDIAPDFPLRGAVCCSECTTPLTSGWCKGKNKKYPYYFCRNKSCSAKGMIARHKIEGEFKTLLSELQPAPSAFLLVRAMFTDRWEQFRLNAAGSLEALNAEINEIEKQIAGIVDKIADISNPRMLSAMEDRVESLERRQLILREKAAETGKPLKSFGELFEHSMRFLANPCKIWESGRFDLQRLVLKLAFSEPLTYSRNDGFLNTKKSFPFSALGGFCMSEKKMVPHG